MGIRSKGTTPVQSFSIWTSFTDLMSNAFMVLTLLFLLAVANAKSFSGTKDEAKSVAKQAQQRANEAEARAAQDKRRADEAEAKATREKKRADRAEARVKKSDAPPIIVISDTGQYQFKSGSAELPPKLRSYIEESLVNAIEENAQKYNIDVIEVIGHTDGQRISDGSTNLDDQLEVVAAGRISVSNLNPASNADLGLLRALSVVQLLQAQQQQGRLKGLGFRPYSAAQLLLPDGTFASIERYPNDERRRIEIRFTQLGKEQKVR